VQSTAGAGAFLKVCTKLKIIIFLKKFVEAPAATDRNVSLPRRLKTGGDV